MDVTQNRSCRSPDQETIPFLTRQCGSWSFSVSRDVRSRKDLSRQYDGVATRWQEIAKRFKLEAAYCNSMIESGFPTSFTDQGEAAVVLDCGVGSGSLSIALQSLVPNRVAYHGIDISSGMLEAAKNAMGQVGIIPTLKQASILSIPYADRTFDLVMSAHVLEHLPDPRKALIEMIRVLKPGGRLFICMTRRSLFGALIQFRWRTWAVTANQGVAWLRDSELDAVNFQILDFPFFARRASIAFWARKPLCAAQTK